MYHPDRDKQLNRPGNQQRQYYNKIPANLNMIGKSKRPEESQYRVHFELRNVYYRDSQAQSFIHNLAIRVSKVARVHLLQIFHFVDDNHVDVSVGLQRDIDALQLLVLNQKKILAQDELGNFKECTVVPSRVFQSYIKKYKQQFLDNHLKEKKYQMQIESKLKQFPQPLLEKRLPDPVLEKRHSHMDKTESNKQQTQITILKNYKSYNQKRGSRQRSRSRKRQKSRSKNRSRSYSKNKQKSSIQNSKQNFACIQKILVFGVPIEYSKRDVQKQLQERKIQVISSQWKHIEQEVQYLVVKLKNPINKSKLDSLCLKISYYPVICLRQCQTQKEIMNELEKKYYPEEDIIYYADKCGQVLNMFYHESNDPRQYHFTIIYNTLSSIKKIMKITKDFRQCTAQKVQQTIKIGRIQKQFTFQELIEGMGKNHSRRIKY